MPESLPAPVPARTAWERLSGLVEIANPMLVRCVRQELRSRTFIGSFTLLLLVSMVSSVIAAWIAKTSPSDTIGHGLFAVLALAWSGAMVVIQGGNTFRAVTQERNDDTWDLVDLTGMGPTRVLRGLMLANMIQGVLFTAPIAPFMVMAYLLRGLDLLTIVASLVLVPLFALAASSLAVLCACLSRQKSSRAVLGGLLTIILATGWIMSFSMWISPSGVNVLDQWISALGRGDIETWLGTIIFFNVWIAWIAFALVLSAALLSHPAENRSTGPRTAAFRLWLNALVWTIALPCAISWFGSYATPPFVECLAAFSVGGVFWAAIVGLFAVSEDYELTPRQARDVIDGRGWRRIRMIVFGPGASRGRLWFLAVSLASVAMSFIPRLIGDDAKLVYASDLAWFNLCFIAILFLVADLLYRGPFSRVFETPAARRASILVCMLVWGWVPLLGLLFDGLNEAPIAWVMSAFTGPYQLTANAASYPIARIVVSLCGIAAMALLGYQGSRLEVVTKRVMASAADRNPRA
jgi:hypothetical protein